MNVENLHGNYALITGGSRGIGKAIAEELAKRGFNLLLVALPDHYLESAAEEIRQKYKSDVQTLAVDLGREDADLLVSDWAVSLGVRITVLVNNAGFGYLGPFEAFDRDFYHQLIQVNVLNMNGITRLLLPLLQDEPEAWVLMVGSVASFFPTPYKSVYSASKHFTLSLAMALDEEFSDTGICFSVLCPGPVATSEAVMDRIRSAGFLGMWFTMSPQRVARIAVKGMFNGRTLIKPGLASKLSWSVLRRIPSSWRTSMLGRKLKKGKVII
jgi:uncharacterized protein